MSIPLTMETLCGGGVIESLHHELQNALDNVADPNTEAKRVREVRLVIKVKPNDHRNMADVTVQASSRQRSARPWTEKQWHTACAVVVASMALAAAVYVLCAAPAVNATTLAMGGL